MSEYWKSTPRYWCKFCSTFVKDTKFEKQQHEATGKHIGSVQRALRNLHKDHERGDREKQRAKDEVARLNGIVTGKPVPPRSFSRPGGDSVQQSQRQLNPEERKRHVAQLADMGVAIPEEYRKDMAIAGDWQTLSGTRANKSKNERKDALSHGVRKRKQEDVENEEEESAVLDQPHQPSWGSRFKSYTSNDDKSLDIGSLMQVPLVKKQEEDDIKPVIKKEESITEPSLDHPPPAVPADITAQVKDEDDITAPVVFKKRKAKAKIP